MPANRGFRQTEQISVRVKGASCSNTRILAAVNAQAAVGLPTAAGEPEQCPRRHPDNGKALSSIKTRRTSLTRRPTRAGRGRPYGR